MTPEIAQKDALPTAAERRHTTSPVDTTLHREKSWLHVWSMLLKTTGGMAVLIGGILAYLDFRSREDHYRQEQDTLRQEKEKADTKYREEQDQKTAESLDLRKKEFRLKLYEEKRPLYHETCTVAAKVAGSSGKSDADTKTAVARFWELYYGEMCLVEDDGVQQAMIDFGTALRQEKNNQLPVLALKLAEKCRQDLNLANVFGLKPHDVGEKSRK